MDQEFNIRGEVIDGELQSRGYLGGLYPFLSVFSREFQTQE
jgi:hypothetical protein